jgi:hypothetical protein
MISSQNCQCRAVPQRRHTVLSKSLTILLPKRRNLALILRVVVPTLTVGESTETMVEALVSGSGAT